MGRTMMPIRKKGKNMIEWTIFLFHSRAGDALGSTHRTTPLYLKHITLSKVKKGRYLSTHGTQI